MYERVVVGVSDPDLAARLLPMAAAVAERAGVPLEVVSVVAGEDEAVRRQGLLEDLVEDHGLGDATCTVLTGLTVAEPLTGYVDGGLPALLGLASATHTRVDEVVIGSTVAGVLHRADGPVLVIGVSCRPDPDPFSGPVVVCTDGSHESEVAVPLAAEWVGRSGQVPWVVTQVGEDVTLDPAHEQAGVHRLAARLGEDAQWEVLRGRHPAEGIAAFAREHDAGLVVMATHGRSGIARAAVGSVAMAVIRDAPCPVLVQRPTGG